MIEPSFPDASVKREICFFRDLIENSFFCCLVIGGGCLKTALGNKGRAKEVLAGRSDASVLFEHS